MYKELIEKLKLRGVEFTSGLDEKEFETITKEYDFKFPRELKKMYEVALPISQGFYNWRDFSIDNIEYIKEVMARPIKDIYDMADEVYWCDNWGEEPNEIEKIKFVQKLLKTAPALIPIYSHRYLSVADVEQSPVFSIHETDIIYYGENLKSYFEIEFGLKSYSDIDYDNISYIPFWTDLL